LYYTSGYFLSHNAYIVHAMTCQCPSGCVSVRHTGALYWNGWISRQGV